MLHISDIRENKEQIINLLQIKNFEAKELINSDDLLRLYDECNDLGSDVSIGSRYVNGVNIVN